MHSQEARCPRCGEQLCYDATMGVWWCPDPECGMVLRRVEGRHNAEPGPAGSVYGDTSAAHEDDLEEKPPRYGRRLFAGLLVLATIAAVVAMTLSPLLWPQRTSLYVSPAQLSFTDDTGSGVMPQALAVQKQGRGELEWNAWSDASWITIEPGAGTLETDLQIVTVRVDTSALDVGTHHSTCTVVAEGAYNSPQTVQVQVQVTEPSETRVISDLLGDAVDVYYDVQPPYVSGPLGVPIDLVNSEAAVDVTWNELVDFLIHDPTDESPYIQDLYMCGAFAEQLHNNAEEAGIRAAWVSIDLQGREVGHALNAFYTLDRGLVFVDCTGENPTVMPRGTDGGQCDHDKVAYVKPGMEYGVISLDRADSLAYEFYIEYSDSWDEYLAALDEFNQRVGEYNDLVSGRSLVSGSEDARRARQLYNQLEAARVSLEMQRELLGPCRWNTLGVVEWVRIYW